MAEGKELGEGFPAAKVIKPGVIGLGGCPGADRKSKKGTGVTSLRFMRPDNDPDGY